MHLKRLNSTIFAVAALMLSGCDHSRKLDGFITAHLPDGRKVSDFRIEKTGAGYQFVDLGKLRGACPFGDSYPAHLADKNELYNMFNGKVPDDSVQALVSPRAATLIVGKPGDLTFKGVHSSTGYLLYAPGGFGTLEAELTDVCYSLDGVAQK
jgi:hypothetical protein